MRRCMISPNQSLKFRPLKDAKMQRGMISPNQSLNFRTLKDAKMYDLPKPIPKF